MQPIEIVKTFLEIVRSGKSPERAPEFMADTVLAHQLNAEDQVTYSRTPANYTDHIRDFLRIFGKYQFEIKEVIAQGDKVYARWEQTGKHMDTLDQYKPTELPLTEIGSAVYRVANGKIAEYWIQVDREGMNKQLEKNQQNSSLKKTDRLPFTDAVRVDSLLYISGQIGIDPVSDELKNKSFGEEATQVMRNIGDVLHRYKLNYSDLVNVTIYLTDMGNYKETNSIYSQYFPDEFPARVCIAVKELPLKASIEICATARLNSH